MTSQTTRAPLTALFIGAGFSHDFKMPLVWDLTRELREWLTVDKFKEINQKWTRNGGGHQPKTVELVCSLLADTDFQYEQIIGNLEVEGRRFENRALFQDIHGVRSWLLELIYLLLLKKHAAKHQEIKEAIYRYKGLATLAKRHKPFWIFSLNHDLIIEMAMAEYGVPIKNGFQEADIIEVSTRKNPTQKERLKRVLIRSEANNYPWDYFNAGSPGINLLKIHGSLDTFGYKDLQEYVCLYPALPGADGYLKALIDINHQVDTALPKATNEIVVYDEGKVWQFLRRSLLSGVYKFDKRGSQVLPNDMLSLFHGSLNYAQELIVIGYSFGDPHINDVMRDWLEVLSSRSIVIVGPEVKVPNFLGHLSFQIKTIKMTTGQYLLSQEDH